MTLNTRVGPSRQVRRPSGPIRAQVLQGRPLLSLLDRTNNKSQLRHQLCTRAQMGVKQCLDEANIVHGVLEAAVVESTLTPQQRRVKCATAGLEGDLPQLPIGPTEIERSGGLM